MSGEAPLALCYGTRPQVVKASMLAEALGARWPLLTIDTGQHYDYELNALLYEQLGVRAPDRCLEVGSADHASQTSAILSRAAEIFIEQRPWAAVVIGDTNSTLGCALAAAKLRIPVVHIEAGLRATDFMMAEEINRCVVDAISSLLCAPSAAAEARLRAEQARGMVVRTGDVARDVLLRNVARAPEPRDMAAWPLAAGDRFVFSTMHRAELTDDPALLEGVLAALGTLGLPVILSAHPRTRAILERTGLLGRLAPTLHLRPPLGYLEALTCVREAAVVVTDSGGLQREAYWLGTPCVTLRAESEWTETLALGANALVPAARAPAELARTVASALDRAVKGNGWDRDVYGRGDAARRISEALTDWRAALG